MDGQLERYSSLVHQILDWDGEEESAHVLRQSVATLELIRGRLDGRMTALRKVVTAYRDQAPHRIRTFFEDPANGEHLAIAAPFIGDPALGGGDWVKGGWERCEEEDGCQYLELVARSGCVVTEEHRGLLRALIRERRRSTWQCAARTGATIALRDETLREMLRSFWEGTFGTTLPKWRLELQDMLQRRDHAEAAHWARHLLYWGCEWLAQGGSADVTPGLSAEVLVRRKVKGLRDADRSVFYTCLTAFARRPWDWTDKARANLRARIQEVGPHPMAVMALQNMAMACAEVDPELAGDIRAVLVQPAWRRAGALEGLWAWLQTAKWLEAQGHSVMVQAMLADAGPASAALRIACPETFARSGQETDLREMLCASLRVLLDEKRLKTSSKDELFRSYILAYEAISHDALRHMDWPAMLHIALGENVPALMFAGTVAQSGALNLSLLLMAHRVDPPGPLIHELLDSILAVTPSGERLQRSYDMLTGIIRVGHDGHQAQAAILASTMLRRSVNDAARIRLMWNLLRIDPSRKFFTEMTKILRAQIAQEPGAGRVLVEQTRMRTLIELTEVVDAQRDSREHLPPSYARLLLAVRQLIPDVQPLDALDALVQAFPLSGQHDDVAEARQILQTLDGLLGEPGQHLLAWPRWLDATEGSPLTEAAERRYRAADEVTLRCLTELKHHVDSIVAGLPIVTGQQYQSLNQACVSLDASVNRLGWPESRLLFRLLEWVQRWGEHQLDLGRAAQNVNHRVQRAIDANEVETCRRIADAPEEEKQSLTHATRKNLSDFFQQRVQRAIDFNQEAECRQIAASPDELARLTPATRKNLSDFFQRRMLLGEAKKVQASLQGEFRSNSEYLRPLYLGAAAGTFFVLDIGEQWLSLITPSGEVFVVRYVITIISCFVLSLGLLAWNVGRNMGTDAEGQYGYDRALVRMLPTFCWTIVIAALVSVMVGWSSGLLELRSWIGWARLPLWTALSLFLGVFLQLIVADQGR